MNLLVIRHALPNRVELAEGRADPGLSEEGIRQAVSLGAWLATEQNDAVYSSHLTRSQQTAQAILDARNSYLKIVT